jgi:predicted transcriptional regulator
MPETSLAEAMSLMHFYQVDCLFVTVDKSLVGCVHLKDILALMLSDRYSTGPDMFKDLRRLQNSYAAIIRADIKRIMVDAAKSVQPSMSVVEAMAIMLNENSSSLAVVEGGKLIGQINFDDLNEAVMDLNGLKIAA